MKTSLTSNFKVSHAFGIPGISFINSLFMTCLLFILLFSCKIYLLNFEEYNVCKKDEI